ncbi:thioredoxin family protein [Aliiroseovarius sp. YM-037]|uniref:thioredoxin family protein n=1 Tax=Aliiroseovarius sp. YM-037 TaxID=3341728 RepID=UPI003A80BD9F
MNRRSFIALSTSFALLPTLSFATPRGYSPGLVDDLLAQGKTVFLDFKADWCSTCAAQERVINALLQENSAYEANIVFVNVDWDQYRGDALTQRLRIPRRSTLVVLKGNQELGRIVAGTSRDDIKALMDTALSAASA